MKKALLSAVSVLLAVTTLATDVSAVRLASPTEHTVRDRYENGKGGERIEAAVLSSSQIKLFQERKAIVSFVYDNIETSDNNLAMYAKIEFTAGYVTYECSVNLSERTVYTGDELLSKAGVDAKSTVTDIVVYQQVGYRLKPVREDTTALITANKNCDVTVAVLDSSQKGWQKAEGNEYYVRKNGQLATSNLTISGTRYKFSANGVYKGKYTGWTNSAKGRRYYKDGKLVKNKWIKTKYGDRYYAGKDGYMVTGKAVIDDELCYFDKNGVWDGLKHARTGEIVVTNTKTGKVYVSKNNGKTWVDGKKPTVYAYADKTKVFLSGKKAKFIYVNNSKETVEHADSGDLWRKGKALPHGIDDVLCMLKAGGKSEDIQYFADYNFNFDTGKKATVIKKGDYEYRIKLGDYEIVVGFEIA